MRNQKIATIPYRRKRQGMTNYHRRLKLLTSRRPRLVVRKTVLHTYANIMGYDNKGDKALVSASSQQLVKLGWNHDTGNIPASYLTGFLLGTRAKKKKVEDAILDLGQQKSIKGSRIYATLAGAVDAGLNVPHDKEMLPKKERLNGSHIASYAALIKTKGHQFSSKKKASPETIVKDFEECKKKIASS